MQLYRVALFTSIRVGYRSLISSFQITTKLSVVQDYKTKLSKIVYVRSVQPAVLDVKLCCFGWQTNWSRVGKVDL